MAASCLFVRYRMRLCMVVLKHIMNIIIMVSQSNSSEKKKKRGRFLRENKVYYVGVHPLLSMFYLLFLVDIFNNASSFRNVKGYGELRTIMLLSLIHI